MQPFERLEGVAAALPMANLDTDMILAGRYLKTVSRTGLGPVLFSALRYDAGGQERADFVLNQPPWRAAQILIAGANFGCGSSREHAPWALEDFGLRCLIAPSFADIFYNNCFKNGLLPIVLDENIVALLMADAQVPARAHMSVDLEGQTVTRSGGEVIAFNLEPDRRRALLEGRDFIADSLTLMPEIQAFERRAQDGAADLTPSRLAAVLS